MKKKMTERQKKSVAIAKDVLKHLREIKPSNGIYVDFESGRLTKVLGNEDLSNKELKPYIPKIRKNCHVCALGACFLSHVGLFNKFKIGNMGVLSQEYYETIKSRQSTGYEGDEIKAVMLKSLGKKNIALIESAFEAAEMGDDDYGRDTDAAILFGNKYQSGPDGGNRKRLKAIMENLIENKGDFKP